MRMFLADFVVVIFFGRRMFLEEGCFWKKDVFSWCYKSLWPFFFWHGKPMRTSENLPMDAAKKSASLTNCCTSKQQAENNMGILCKWKSSS